MNDRIAQLERIACRIWPAEQEVSLGEWTLRASQGVTKRANSLFTNRERPANDDWLAIAEAFYKERGLPVHIHVSDDTPIETRLYLESQGYFGHTPCSMMEARTQDVVALAGKERSKRSGPAVRSEVLEDADEQWLTRFLELEQFGEDRMDFYASLFRRMPKPRAFVRLSIEDVVVAVGTVVASDGWAGIVNVCVDEACRGQGLGYSIMHMLSDWANERNIENVFLQVVTDNVPAGKLYGNIGFKPIYGYQYWSEAAQNNGC